MIGYAEGWLIIFDLQNNQILKEIPVLSGSIFSVIFLKDNKTAFVCDNYGYIHKIRWQTGANSVLDFSFIEERKKVGNLGTESICLTKDEKYLLVGSEDGLSILETETRKVTKEFKLTYCVMQITLIEDGKKAFIAEYNGDLSIIDLETWEIFLIAKKVANGKGLRKIAVI